MPLISTNNVVIARFAGALYDLTLDNNTNNECLNAANTFGVDVFLNSIYYRDFSGTPTGTVAAIVVKNLGLTGSAAVQGIAYITGQLNAAAANTQGAVLVGILNLFGRLTTDPTFGPAASAWEAKVVKSVAYSQDPAHTSTVPLSSIDPDGNSEIFTLTTNLDKTTAHQFIGSETHFAVDGKGPTLNAGDQLTGTAGRTDNSLIVTDLTPGVANGVIPAGVSLTNIQNITLQSTNNTAAGIGFSTAAFADVRNLTVITNGDLADLVTARNGEGGTVVNATHLGFGAGSLTTVGGTDVTARSSGSGGIVVGSPGQARVPLAAEIATGVINVNQNGTGAGLVGVFGGSSVNVTTSSSSNTGTIDVGNTTLNTGNSVAGIVANTTGNITVNTAGSGAVTVFGGADVVVNDTALGGSSPAAGAITVGDVGFVAPSNLPSGNVTVTESASIAYNGLAGSSNNAKNGGAIGVYGGKNIAITTNAANVINIGNLGAVKENALNATGTINVTNTGVETAAATGNMLITGGTNVTVSTTGSNVTIGRTANAVIDQASNPSGDVTVTETMNGNGFGRTVTINGGEDIVVNAKGQNVVVGTAVKSAPTGSITVTQSDMLTGNTDAYLAGTNAGNVTVAGGTTVTVNTTGGHVAVGAVVGGVNTVSSGTVDIARTFSGPGADTTAVQGGTTVNITTTKTSGAVTVGAASDVLTADGTALKDVALAPTGDVTIVNATTVLTATAYGTGVTNVRTNGATTVSVKGGNVDNIIDVKSTKATGGSNAGKAVGTSTLATVVVEGLAGADGFNLNSDVLADLTVLNTKGGANTITVNNNTAAHALTVTQGGNATGNNISVVDAKAGTVTVKDNATDSTAVLAITAATATALTVDNAAKATVNLAGDVALTTITLKGAGSVTLQNVGTLGKIASIDASASKGAVTTDLTVTSVAATSQKFIGGSGVTKLTVSSNAFSYGDGVSLTGGTGTTDVIVANYAAAGTDIGMGNTAAVKGFEILGLGANAVGTYDATGFSGVTLGAVAGATVITNAAKNVSLSITAAPGASTTLTPSSATNGTADPLTINVNTNTANAATGLLPDGINAGTVTANGYETISIVSNGAGGSQQPAANTMTLVDTASAGTGTLAISGQGKLTLTDTTTRFSKIDVTNSTAVDVSAVTASNAGVAITGSTGSLKAVGAAGGTQVSKIVLDGTTTKTFAVGDTWVVQLSDTNTAVSFTYTAAAADTMATAGAFMAAAINAGATTGPVVLVGVNPGVAATNSNGSLVLTKAGTFQAYGTLGGGNTGTVTTSTAALVGGLEEQLITISGTTTAAALSSSFNINGTAVTYTAAAANETAATVASGLATAINALVAANKIGVNSAVASGANVIITGGSNGTYMTTTAPGAVLANGITTTVGATAINYATANDSFTTGSGGGTYAAGLGGSWSNTVHRYSAGSETVNLGASTAKVDYIKLADGRVVTNNGTTGGANGFTVGSLSASDALFFATVGKTAATNVGTAAAVSTLTNAATMAAVLDPSGALLTALGNLTYTLSNGVITFSATGGHSLSEFTTAQLISAAEIIVNSPSNSGGANKAAVFSSGGNSYVVVSDAGNTLNAGVNAADVLVQLTGVAATTGFGSTGAQGTVVVANTVDGVTNTFTNVVSNKANTGTATVAIYDQTGFSADNITAGEFGTVSTSITNLAPSAALTLNGGAATLEAVSISQTGSAGLNSLTLTTAGGDVFKSITTNGDGLLVLNPTAATTINSLVDGGSTNTLATIQVAAGGAALDVKAITDTALTTVDSTAATAAVTFGSTTALANEAMTFKLAVGFAANITASGAKDVFTQGVPGSLVGTEFGAGVVTLVASGAGNTITLSNGANNITANGAGDVISVGTGSNTIVATGSDDVFNIASGAGTTSVKVGSNAAVNIGTLKVANGGAETVNVSTAMTGATAADAFAKTTVTFVNASNVAPETEDHIISFAGTAEAYTLLGAAVASSQINVATATSLSEALNMAANYTLLTQVQGTAASTANLAANTGKVDWFQYGGDTYVVAMVNDTGAAVQQTGLDANDIVVKIVGMVDLTGGAFAAEALTI